MFTVNNILHNIACYNATPVRYSINDSSLFLQKKAQPKNTSVVSAWTAQKNCSLQIPIIHAHIHLSFYGNCIFFAAKLQCIFMPNNVCNTCNIKYNLLSKKLLASKLKMVNNTKRIIVKISIKLFPQLGKTTEKDTIWVTISISIWKFIVWPLE